jgi:hypothetical protein
VQGTARGAAGGAIIGGIAGDAGQGAAIGAVAGTMVGGRNARRNQDARNSQAQADRQNMRIDLEKKVVGGPKQSTPILSMDKTADGLLLQGNEIGFGWTRVIDMSEGTMAATLVNKDGAFVLFGSCTPL